MAINGWSVVALTEVEGNAMEQPDDPATIHEKLRAYVEAPSPLGPMLRGPFANELAVGDFETGPAKDLEEVSLSVRATRDQREAAIDAAGELKPAKPNPPQGVKAPKSIKTLKSDLIAGADASRAYIHLRLVGDSAAVNTTHVILSRLDAAGAEVIYDGRPTTALIGNLKGSAVGKGKVAEDKYYDFMIEAPEGRWKVATITHQVYAADLCFGAPAFELAPGEAVTLGAMSVRKTGGYPLSQDIAVAKEILAANPVLAEKVKTAEWTNGFTSDCFGSYAYAYEIPGAPFVDMEALARAAAQNADSRTLSPPEAPSANAPPDAAPDTNASEDGGEQ
jgi:hypothetical protein